MKNSNSGNWHKSKAFDNLLFINRQLDRKSQSVTENISIILCELQSKKLDIIVTNGTSNTQQ